VPRCMGGTSLTVLTGSMEPAIKPGDMVATRGVDAANQNNFTVGQVIAFLPYPNNPTVVTHRITAVTQGPDGVSYTTKGDANNSVDPWGPVAASHVRGQVVYVVPKVGYVRQWVMEHFPVSASILGVVLIAYGIFAYFSTLRRHKPDDAPPADDADGQAQLPPDHAASSPDHAASSPDRVASSPDRVASSPDRAASSPDRAASSPDRAASSLDEAPRNDQPVRARRAAPEPVAVDADTQEQLE